MSFEGKWVNELGSTMEITRAADAFEGAYTSSKAGHDPKQEPLKGLSRAGASGITYLGWTVCYTNVKEPEKDPSVCTWSGQYLTVDGKETIQTTWLLTHMSEQTSRWDNTTIGKNTFTRLA